MSQRVLFLLVLLAAFLTPETRAHRAVDVKDLVDELQAKKDDADPLLIEQLGDLKSRAAMEALKQVYFVMDSVYMRREVLRGLAKMDRVDDAWQPALQQIQDVATGARERELREAAIKILGTCESHGKRSLELIVDSSADDMVREKALEQHIEMSTADDQPFYGRLFREGDGTTKEKKKDKPKKGEPEDRPKVTLPRVRELALTRIVDKLSLEELILTATTKEKDDQDLRRDGVRRMALEELGKRKEKRALEIANETFEDTTEHSANRAVAAQVIYDFEGAKMADEFVEAGSKSVDVTPVDLKNKLADLLAQMDDKGANGKLEKMVGKGKLEERVFAIRALRKAKEPKLLKTFVKLLADKELQIQLAACDALAVRGDAAAIPDLEKVLLASVKKPELNQAAFEALNALHGRDEKWLERLTTEVDSPDPMIRNAALDAIARLAQKKFIPYFIKAIDSDEWSTRLSALKGLEILATVEAIDAIVERMAQEEGRMLREFADALWRLTGQLLPPDAAVWKKWWEETKAGYKPLGTGDQFRLQMEAEARTLRQLTKQSFYGIRIVSHRVIFILDVSGSMNEPTRSEFAGKVGESRMEVAKRELIKCVDALDKDALFNLIVFSGDVEKWLDQGVTESKDADRQAAKEFVQRLGANGGTNLYGALELAFEDQDVDTIYVLSDGEPSVGKVIDQQSIRERVANWNEHRKIVIHTIAVGGKFQVLEWLAQDTGGSHVRYP